MVAFWGCEILDKKAAVVNVPKGFVLNVVNVTCGSVGASVTSTLYVETKLLDGKVWKGAVAHLGARHPPQAKLDLVFGQDVKFYLSNGSEVVHLSGYFQPCPPVDSAENGTTSLPSKASKKTNKRVRDDNTEVAKTQKEVIPSNGSATVSKKKTKTTNQKTPPPSAKKEVQEKTPEAEAVDSAAQKKKRKKNKGKKSAASPATDSAA
ncbi:putative Nucleoplasmin-like domain-containing protein [Plasmopara halstedii]